MHDNDETRFDRPPRTDRTITQTFSAVPSGVEISVDDLPAAPATPTRRDLHRDAAELAEVLRYQLHALEAQVVSLGRELVATAQGAPADAQRALHLVTTSINSARTALRAVDRFEARLEAAPRAARPRTPVPTR